MVISIITATYNSSSTIKECISSAQEQTCEHIEQIIIDGASSDSTIDLIKKLSCSTMRIISEEDKGIYDAINKGIEIANNSIVGILHSDDLFASPNILKIIEQTFEQTDADIVYGDLVYVEKNNPYKIIRYWKSQPFQQELINKGWMPPHPTVFMKKSVYEKHGVFDLNFKISADYDLMLRVFKDASLKKVYIPEIITKMRIGGASNKSLKNIIRKSSEDYLALRKNKFKHPLAIVMLKNLRKLPQFIKR